MVNPSLFLKSGLTILGIVYLFFFVQPLKASASPNELWSISLEQLKTNNPQEACRNLKLWVSEQASHQVKSAEAMFNLGVCSWQTKEPASSVLYFLEGLQLRSSPLKKWSDIQILKNIQKEIGMRENLAERTTFILRMLFPLEVSVFFAWLGGWLLLVIIIFRKHTKRYPGIYYTAVSMCWLIGLIIFAFQATSGPIAVISDGEDKPIIAFDRLGAPKELTRLPAGTLLELGPNKQEFTQIVKPIGGWVKTDYLQKEISSN